MTLVIYLIGYCLAYIVLRGVPKSENEDNTWASVLLRCAGSLLSWGIVCIGILSWVIDAFTRISLKTKPPKWL